MTRLTPKAEELVQSGREGGLIGNAGGCQVETAVSEAPWCAASS